MNEAFSSSNIEPELQVRLMNLVMGEASDFERDQLQSLMEQRAELMAYYQHLELLHDLLRAVGSGDSTADKDSPTADSDWQLPADRREPLLAVLDGKEKGVGTKVGLASAVATKTWDRRSRWLAVGTVAAAACVLIGLMLPGSIAHRRSALSTTLDLFISPSSPSSQTAQSPLPSAYFLSDDVQYFPNRRSAMEPASGKPSAGEAVESEGLDRSGFERKLDFKGPMGGGGMARADGGIPAVGAPAKPGNGEVNRFSQDKASMLSDASDARQSEFLSRDLYSEAKSRVWTEEVAAVDGLRTAELGLDLAERGGTREKDALFLGSGSTSTLSKKEQEGEQAEDWVKNNLGDVNGLPNGPQNGLLASPSLLNRVPQLLLQQESEPKLSWAMKSQGGATATQDFSEVESLPMDAMSTKASSLRFGMETPDAAFHLGEGKRAEKNAESETNARVRDMRFRELNRPFSGSPDVSLPAAGLNDITKFYDRQDEKSKSSIELHSDGRLAEIALGKRMGTTPASEFELEPRGERRAGDKKSVPQQQRMLEEQSASSDPFSTFSLHVSDVSFKLAQAAIAQGQWPASEKIRIEEFVNALDYQDPLPVGDQKVACRMEQAIHPFLIQRNLLRVSMRTSATGRSQNTPLRLTILLDNSGSMERSDRRQALLQAFRSLTQLLGDADQITLISFASTPRLLADKVPGNQSASLLALIENLPSEGGTNIEAALMLAREKATEQQLAGAQNRIVMLTDGAVNLGDANPESLAKLIAQMRDAGIAFDAAGIVAQDVNDQVLEALTRRGDGRYYLLGSSAETSEGFAAQLAGALRPSAKNVKVQVEFNPQRVGRYKLLGFEKHRLNKEDFRNDQVDAAEMAAAEAGVAVYQFEIKPNGSGDVGSVSVRFQDLSTGQMVERRWPILYESNTPRLESAPASIQLASIAALFAARLAGGPLAESVDLAPLLKILKQLPEQVINQTRVQQLQAMIEKTITSH